MIDAHQHFWSYDPGQYGWLTPGMSRIARDFLPEDLAHETASTDVVGSVAVQARQSLEETTWLLALARRSSLIQGVVGWVDLAAPDCRRNLDRFTDEPKLVGVRHVVQDEPDEFLLRTDFNHGVSLLREFGLTYDILVYPRQLTSAIRFVNQHPEQVFVIDHLAKPRIRRNGFDHQWAGEIAEIAKRENVYAKVSGLVTEVQDADWTTDDLRPYWEVALESFGPGRLIFGSDWPVCLLRSPYSDWRWAFGTLTAELTSAERSRISTETARVAYRLSDGHTAGTSISLSE